MIIILTIFEKNNNINWENIESYKIENYKWDVTGYKPEVEVKMFYTKLGFNIRFTVKEEKVMAMYKTINSPVYQDSCVEFFIQPDIMNNKNYINFEINALGVALIQIGKDGIKRYFIDEENFKLLSIKSDINVENINEFDNFKPWSVHLFIPFEFIKIYFPSFDLNLVKNIKCNFYKCGDKTKHAHYGSMFPIDYNKPSFHRPEFFGNIYLK